MTKTKIKILLQFQTALHYKFFIEKNQLRILNFLIEVDV